MNDFKKFSKELSNYSFFWILINSLLTVGAYLLFSNIEQLGKVVSLILTAIVASAMSMGIAKLVILAVSEPFKAVWQAINQIDKTGDDISAPQPNALSHGRNLAIAMIQEIYKISSPAIITMPSASVAATDTPKTTAQQTNLLELMPMPVIILDASDRVIMLNQTAAKYLEHEEIIGKPIVDVLQISFQTNDTLESWLANAKSSSVTASSSWDRVRLQLPDEKGIKQFDLMAYYNKGNPAHYETMLALFDHTDRYSKEDGSTSYVALAVHELRTPLTVLRGYIEVFEDELDGKLTPELQDFMHKMRASAQTLTAFVSNILNVARVDENQLTLSLHEANWNELLPEIVKDIELRAKVRGKTLELDIKPNLPTVSVDKVSIYEVVSNLVENAIKYSGSNNKIVIHAQVGKDANIETVVQDYGIGIPDANIKYLFTKFYRSHRSRGSVSGSGLGLYLVKAIVTAHGGNVWVNSKEGEGSSFGFSLQPYTNMATEPKDASGANIEREAHGWIKNHSMYRR